MLSQTAEYALRAAVCLAGSGDEPKTTLEIARVAQVPPDYLSKILQALGRAGVVKAQRGKHGGFTLVRSAEDTCVLDILNAVDPLRRIHRCPLRLAAHQERLCPLHRRLDEAAAQIESAFRGTSLAQLLSEDPEIQPLCLEPAHA